MPCFLTLPLAGCESSRYHEEQERADEELISRKSGCYIFPSSSPRGSNCEGIKLLPLRPPRGPGTRHWQVGSDRLQRWTGSGCRR